MGYAHIVYLGTVITPLLRTIGLDVAVHTINKSIQENVVDKDAGRSQILEFDALGTSPPEDMLLGDIHHLSPEGHAKLALTLLPVIRDNLAAAEAARFGQ